jgi:hypothetical protein
MPAFPCVSRAVRHSGIARLRAWVQTFCISYVVLLAAAPTANAQFKVIGPAPYSDAVAHQKIKALLGKVDPANRQQTLDTISGLLAWYRDILDEELIAAWQKGDGRADLAPVMKPLADSRVAAAVVEFSWRQQRQETFTLAYAPMFVGLMTRSPDGAKPFLDDLLGASSTAAGQQTLALSQPEIEAVCRILLDLPDIRTWRKSALRILPNYRAATEYLLAQDLRSDNSEKRDQAEVWRADLRFDAPAPASVQNPRRSPQRSSQPSLATRAERAPTDTMWPPAGAVDASSSPAVSAPPVAVSAPARAPLPAAEIASEPQPYDGPRSGTLECSGGPIAQNAEYVFRNVPPVRMQLDYDTKVWEARLSPGEGQTQRLILKNKSSGPQKRCVVHWSVIP